MMGGFLTEECASRKWFMQLFSYMSFGIYSIGKNNGNIFVQDRYTGKLIEERIPMYIRLGLRMLHQNLMRTQTANYAIVKRLFKALSIRQGIKFDDPASKKLIPEFVKYHEIPMHEVQRPIEEFATFNEFFYRELKPGMRPIRGEDDPLVIVSPADCRCNVYNEVGEATQFWIKGRDFSIQKLLDDQELGIYFQKGALMLGRLAPQDYHRFHCPVDGKLISVSTITGQYYTVNPMAVRQRIDILTENLRVVYLLENPNYGKVAIVAVGALLVGSIKTTKSIGKELKKGEELGYFAFGGSTIVLVFKENTVKFSRDLAENSLERLETLIRMGDQIGNICAS
jgi:phosphatidylserine decarboxylase